MATCCLRRIMLRDMGLRMIMMRRVTVEREQARRMALRVQTALGVWALVVDPIMILFLCEWDSGCFCHHD